MHLAHLSQKGESKLKYDFDVNAATINKLKKDAYEHDYLSK